MCAFTLYFIQASTVLQHALRDICLNEHRMYEISFFIYSMPLTKPGAACCGTETRTKYRNCPYPNPNIICIP